MKRELVGVRDDGVFVANNENGKAVFVDVENKTVSDELEVSAQAVCKFPGFEYLSDEDAKKHGDEVLLVMNMEHLEGSNNE